MWWRAFRFICLRWRVSAIHSFWSGCVYQPVSCFPLSSNISFSGSCYLTSPDNQQDVTTTSVFSSPNTTPPLFKGLQFTIWPSDHPLQVSSKEPSTPNSSLSDIRFLSRPNQFKLRTTGDVLTLGRQHRREIYVLRAEKVKRPRFLEGLHFTLKPIFSSWEIIFWKNCRQENTLEKTSAPSQRIVLSPQDITALPCECISFAGTHFVPPPNSGPYVFKWVYCFPIYQLLPQLHYV